jgi:sigma-B regulation protein RsbU (phosphoserine phosphatase)
VNADVTSSSCQAESTPWTPEVAVQGLCDWIEAALDQHALVGRVVEEVRTTLGAQKALFFLAKRDSRGIEFHNPDSGDAILLTAGDAFARRIARPGLHDLKEQMSASAFCQRLVEELGVDLGLAFSYEGRVRGLALFGNSDVTISTLPDLSEQFARLGELAAQLVEHSTLRDRYRREALEKEILLEVVREMSASLDLSHVLTTIIDGLHTVVPYDQAVIFLLNRESWEIEQLVHRGYRQSSLEKLRLKIGEGVSGWVAKTGRSVIVPDVHADSRYIEVQPSTKSEIAVPLFSSGEVVGVFNLESDQPGAFENRHLELLEAFASQAAVAIERARLHHEVVLKHALERELRFAREIQKALLPKKMPRARNVSLSALNIPSRHVSGDLYDAVKFAEGRIGIAIGDVSGKGTPGAILMATLFGIYRSEVRRGLPAHKLMSRLNRRFMENLLQGGFATFFYAVLDPTTLKFEYCNAGHNPPILLRADGRVDFLDTGGIILGFSPKADYERRQIQLASGDLLCLYTDGVTEAESPQDELFGRDRLVDVLRRNRDGSVSELKRKILETITKFSGDAPPEDDVTVVLLKVK